ncbi:TfoX/Sxy family protein [Candidatus Thioglobus sp.]|uniref:TfoX/Sxy family protein n=1 Tax=Candidatus Thioglobus sp. TaxID=2026721 RepID=UPI003D0F22C8
MVKNNQFVLYLLEMLQAFGQVQAKPMFGGFGIYRDELIFAIVVDDALYIKADEDSLELFNKEELPRFTYLKNGKACFMAYYQVPDEAVDDIDVLNYWAQIGCQAALRTRKTTT